MNFKKLSKKYLAYLRRVYDYFKKKKTNYTFIFKFVLFIILYTFFKVGNITITFNQIVEFFTLLPWKLFSFFPIYLTLLIYVFLCVGAVYYFYVLLTEERVVKFGSKIKRRKFFKQNYEIRISTIAIIIAICTFGFTVYEYIDRNSVKVDFSCELTDSIDIVKSDNEYGNGADGILLGYALLGAECRIRNQSINDVTIEKVKPVWYFSDMINLRRGMNEYSWEQPKVDTFIIEENYRIQGLSSKLITGKVAIPIGKMIDNYPNKENIINSKNSFGECINLNNLDCLGIFVGKPLVNYLYETITYGYGQGNVRVNGVGATLVLFNGKELTSEVDMTVNGRWVDSDIEFLSFNKQRDNVKENYFLPRYKRQFCYREDNSGTCITFLHSLIEIFILIFGFLGIRKVVIWLKRI